MRARLLAPTFAAALALSLAACDEPDAVADIPAAEPPATAQPAPEVAEEPAGDSGEGQFAAESFALEGLSERPSAPMPSSVFEEGVEALGEVDAPASGVFADAPFEPGVYEAEDVVLTLEPEGAFTLELTSGEGGRFAGEARVYGDMMTLSNVDGRPGRGGFPMTCRIAPAPAEGFALAADGASCSLLDGSVFTPSG